MSRKEKVVQESESFDNSSSVDDEMEEDEEVEVFTSDLTDSTKRQNSKPVLKETKRGRPKAVRTVRGYGATAKLNIEKKKIQCTVENCQYSTPYAKDLQRHMRKHTGEKPFQCSTCPKAFSRRDKLKIHTMTHEGNRPYICDVCSYATVDATSLRKHQRTHTNERPYKCQLCPYQGKDSSQLVVHLRHHTGDTPYSCMFANCSAAFKTPSDLQRHSRSHTGEKPFKCPYCDHRAAVKCNLNSHVRKIHKDLVGETVTDGVQVSGLFTTDIIVDIKDSTDIIVDVKDSTDSKENPTSTKEGDFVSTLDPLSVVRCTTEEEVVDSPTNESDLNQIVSCITNIKSTTTRKSTASKKKYAVSSEQNLPFQYACKACSAKCDNYDIFLRHMQRAHKDILKVNETAKAMVKSRKRHVFKPEIIKQFGCTSCNASFAREDSLRCHLRQHAKIDFPIPSVTMTGSNNKNQMGTSSRLASPISQTFPSSTCPINVSTLLPGGDDLDEEPLIMHQRSAIIDGQTQNVYVIVRNETATNSTGN